MRTLCRDYRRQVELAVEVLHNIVENRKDVMVIPIGLEKFGQKGSFYKGV